MNNSVKNELERYISELDTTMNRLRNCDFPYSDILAVYEEVCDHLKTIADAE